MLAWVLPLRCLLQSRKQDQRLRHRLILPTPSSSQRVPSCSAISRWTGARLASMARALCGLDPADASATAAPADGCSPADQRARARHLLGASGAQDDKEEDGGRTEERAVPPCRLSATEFRELRDFAVQARARLQRLCEAAGVAEGGGGSSKPEPVVASDGRPAVEKGEGAAAGELLRACEVLLAVCSGDGDEDEDVGATGGADARGVLALDVDLEASAGGGEATGASGGSSGSTAAGDGVDEGEDEDLLGVESSGGAGEGAEGGEVEGQMDEEEEEPKPGAGAADAQDGEGNGDESEDDLVADLEGFLGEKENQTKGAAGGD